MSFQLTRQDVRSYTGKHRNAMMFHSIGANDYIASRCCLLSGLLSQGYILADIGKSKL
jgi:hypothetical protein